MILRDAGYGPEIERSIRHGFFVIFLLLDYSTPDNNNNDFLAAMVKDTQTVEQEAKKDCICIRVEAHIL